MIVGMGRSRSQAGLTEDWHILKLPEQISALLVGGLDCSGLGSQISMVMRLFKLQ